MFKTKFASLDDRFGCSFTQDNTSIQGNFNCDETLKGECVFSPIVEVIKTKSEKLGHNY